VLFNRFLQTDVDIENESIFFAPNYSTPHVLHAQLRWTAFCATGCGALWQSAAAFIGAGLVKALLVGADEGYICSVLHVRKDFGVIREILEGLSLGWIARGYASLADSGASCARPI
jgi:hypothetical protein